MCFWFLLFVGIAFSSETCGMGEWMQLFSNGTFQSCQPCPMGTYQSSSSHQELACSLCPYWLTTAEIGSNMCTKSRLCTIGQYYDQIHQVCNECTPGKYQGEKTHLFSDCVECPEGTYQPSAGSSSCLVCTNGTSTTLEHPLGNTKCSRIILCNPGWYLTTTNRCDPCPAGSFQPNMNSRSVNCTLCPIDTYTNRQGSSVCTPCVGASVAPTPGSTQCISHSEIQMQSLQLIREVNCTSGFFGPYWNQTCIACPKGQYQPYANQTTCMLCPPGSFSNQTASTSCTLCAPSFYAQDTGNTQCSPCPSALYAIDKGSSHCADLAEFPMILEEILINRYTDYQLCPKGMFTVGYNDSSQTVVCELCPLGQYQNLRGQAECIPCPPGQYSSKPGRYQCEMCSTGTYQPYYMGSTCIPCAKGTYSTTLGLVDGCQNCSAGKYQPREGQSVCVSCPPGTYQPMEGSHECIPCPKGFYGSSISSSTCSGCPLGTFASREGMVSCEPCALEVSSDRSECREPSCPPGTQLNVEFQTCDKCPMFTYSSGGNSRCLACPPYTYTLTEGSAECIYCTTTKGLVCVNHDVIVESGYWVWEESNPNAPGNISIQSTVCPKRLCSKEYSYLQSRIQWAEERQSNNTNYNVLSSVIRCANDRDNSPENIMCGRCKDNLKEWSNQCIPCSKRVSNIMIAVGFFSICLVFVGILYWCIQHSYYVFFPTLFLFVQTAARMTEDIQEVNIFAKWTMLDGHDSFTNQCLVPLDQEYKVAFNLLSVFGYLGFCIFLAGIHWGVHRITRLCLTTDSKWYIAAPQRERYLSTLYCLLAMSYEKNTLMSFQILNCQTFGEDSSNSVMYQIPGIQCHTPKYTLLFILAICSLALYTLGFPIVLYRMMSKRVEQWRQQQQDESISPNACETDDSCGLNNFPFFNYLQSPYWYTWCFFRQTSFACITVFLAYNPTYRSFFHSIHLLVCIFFHMMGFPFTHIHWNWIESICLFVLFLLALTNLSFPDLPTYDSKIFMNIYIGMGILLILFLGFLTFHPKVRQWFSRHNRTKEDLPAVDELLSKEMYDAHFRPQLPAEEQSSVVGPTEHYVGLFPQLSRVFTSYHPRSVIPPSVPSVPSLPKTANSSISEYEPGAPPSNAFGELPASARITHQDLSMAVSPSSMAVFPSSRISSPSIKSQPSLRPSIVEQTKSFFTKRRTRDRAPSTDFGVPALESDLSPW